MTFGEFLYIQPDNIKKQVQNIENLEMKLANARVAIVFNETCLNIYICIYIYIHLGKIPLGLARFYHIFSLVIDEFKNNI